VIWLTRLHNMMHKKPLRSIIYRRNSPQRRWQISNSLREFSPHLHTPISEHLHTADSLIPENI
jgi:hypothetical protein